MAFAALILGLMSWIHFFGIEKAGLAVIFSTWALQDPALSRGGRIASWCAIAAGIIYLAVICVLAFHHFHGMGVMLQPVK